MKIEDIEIDVDAEAKEDKRKRLHHYKTFKKNQEKEMGGFQINIIGDEKDQDPKTITQENESSLPLKKKISVKGEQLSGENIDSEFQLTDTILPARRKKKRYSSAILESVKIGTDSFRTVKDHKFSDDYTIINCIGQGGYGKVYKVKHNQMGHTRAMKSKYFPLKF